MNKFFVLLFFACSLAVGCGTAKTAQQKVAKKEIYRDYVLYKCLVLGYGAAADFSQDITPAVYNDFVEYSLSAPFLKGKLDSLATRKVADIKPSPIEDFNNKKATFMQCLTYYNSAELKKEIKKIVKEFEMREKRRLSSIKS